MLFENEMKDIVSIIDGEKGFQNNLIQPLFKLFEKMREANIRFGVEGYTHIHVDDMESGRYYRIGEYYVGLVCRDSGDYICINVGVMKEIPVKTLFRKSVPQNVLFEIFKFYNHDLGYGEKIFETNFKNVDINELFLFLKEVHYHAKELIEKRKKIYLEKGLSQDSPIIQVVQEIKALM